MKAGVVLSGCGVMDGSEIHEAVLTMLCLDKAGCEILAIAPDENQKHVVNHHSNNTIEGESRNMLQESARIARGNIQPVGSIHANSIDTLVFPGGFGAAKNLCNFTDKGPECLVDPGIENLINEMMDKNKSLGALCIAPVIIARVLGSKGCRVRLTIGNDPEVAAAINTMGAEHIDCPYNKAVTDKQYNVVTSPAYMLAKSIKEVEDSVNAMVNELITL